MPETPKKCIWYRQNRATVRFHSATRPRVLLTPVPPKKCIWYCQNLLALGLARETCSLVDAFCSRMVSRVGAHVIELA